ncbi:MAG: DEAD/DEAH box helicase family protein [Erysipelotrichaceae bacterium]|uniref:type I restriction endonuclease subunit R n=1 Tax=Floccifex sp. TaxID=2815810 RepID=UPI002A75DE4B|nr:DEAD/DEAH box helicase family protein [Floccifex sp.]MDD7281777.1 DEAD/DEAH box helicase family protein [Erysipelotrichaceae bacterium]MDY2958851.1 DEAD/DEAH box helicase family protein [Floccifex sp.]
MNGFNEELEKLYIIFETAEGKDPQDVALVCRQVLEKSIDLIFKFLNVRKPVSASLLELINNEAIQAFFDNDVILDELHFIRIVGVNAYHNKHIRSTQAKVAQDNVEFLLQFLKAKFNNEDLVVNKVKTISDVDENIVSCNKKSNELTEYCTRKVYIDLYLQEAGWEVLEPKSQTVLPNGTKVKSGNPIPGKACSEIMVKGLPTKTGIGFCDYVLYGRDGKPLAIVEAKRTSVDAIKGQQQVREYGRCMEKQYGYIPVLYYTNGYDIYVIDGKYPPRKVSAFHTLDELTYIIQKRSNNGITDMQVNKDIAGRPYQVMAITNICERFNKMHRRGLLVMATGTGKTRTAIALVELLIRNKFIKNVLFLADRTSLVRQAFKNFQKLLPDMTYCVASDKSLANDDNARITFSTHQTMINLIDQENKDYTVGRFDLIIIDEAHRSIFNKYGAIFDYFDSLLVGLTATPKDEVDANTYDLFNCESGVPNFAYSLKEAVEEKYLVPYKLVNRTSKQLENGIEYDDLSEEDKERVNELTDENFDDGDLISKNKLFSKVFNKDTCRKVLDDLMNQGLRVNQGQVLGKTIIFAVNHFHANLIVETFNELYPQYPNYCKLIDNQIKNSEHLIDEFETDDEFRIAVSVDMLDTGIDVPSVLNLVFFKRVNSSIKLIQMIGRGTRLCENLIDGKDKQYFLIFDYFNNLKDENPENIKQPISISQKLFEIRLDMMCEMQTSTHQSNPEHKNYYIELKNIVYSAVKAIKDTGSQRMSVRAVMSTVDKYYDFNNWEYIGSFAQKEIKHVLAPLIQSDIKEHYLTLSYDYKMLQIEEILITDGNVERATALIKNIRLIAQKLLDKGVIVAIDEKKDDLNEMYKGDIWLNPTISTLEY